jgi:hypothetical protein
MRSWGVRLILVVVALGITACGSDGRTSSRTPEDSASDASGEPPPPVDEAAGPPTYPTCGEIKAALGPAVDGLVELAESDNGPMDGQDEGVQCAWHTQALADTSLDLESYAGIAVGISTMADPYVEDDMRAAGYVVDDPRADDVGAYVVNLDGADFDPAEQIDALGVQVVVGDTAVILTAGGVMLQDSPELAALTNDWAIGGGVRVWELMR